jgi:CHAD domain-containing protein
LRGGGLVSGQAPKNKGGVHRLESVPDAPPLRAAPLPLAQCRILLGGGGDFVVDKKAMAAGLVEASIARGAARLVKHDPELRLGRDEEAVHQARVATRRLRSDIKTFAPLLKRGWVRRIRGELRWLGGCLGQVRDLDVLTEQVTRSARALGEDGLALTVLLDDLRAARDARYVELRSTLGDRRYLSLLSELCAASSSPPLEREAFEPAVAVVGGLVARPWKKVQKAVSFLGEVPSDTNLHTLRIRAKALRYACEAVSDVAPVEAGKLARRAKALQTVLGEHQDAVSLRAYLREAAWKSRDHAYAAGLCLSLSIGEDDPRAWRQAWLRLEEPRLSRWLS